MRDSFEQMDALAAVIPLANSVAPALVVVIGARALFFHRPRVVRLTRDIDLALAVNIDHFELPAGWTRFASAPHSWRDPNGREFDIIPASPAHLDCGLVRWPGGAEMSLIGFDLVMTGAVRVPGFPDNLRVADLTALAVCKIVAWSERPGDRAKDLGDLAVILETYADSDQPEFYDVDDAAMEYEARAAYLLGRDIARRGTPVHRDVVEEFVDRITNEPRRSLQFLEEARCRGNWDANLTKLRLQALRSGIAPRSG